MNFITSTLVVLTAVAAVADGKGRKGGKGSKRRCLGGLLTAEMSASNGYDGNVSGTVDVCFNDPLGDITGSLKMFVEGLPVLITGGVHIHEGIDCATTESQGGHYWDKEILTSGGPLDNGDAWFNIASELAPSGTGYTTDEDGTGYAYFSFNNAYVLFENKGRAVVIHGEVETQAGVKLGDGSYPRIACGILQ
jgi:Cu/Zn superoxide dismutase